MKPERNPREQSAAMVKTPAAATPEEVAIKMKAITPRVPEIDLETLQLEEDLDRMGCLQLLNRPWELKSEYMLRELGVGAPYKYKATPISQPNQWTAMAWRKACSFGTEGKGLCARNEDFT